MNDEKLEIQKAHCNSCLQETKHFIVAERCNVGSEEVDNGRYEVSWKTTYKMLECCGCETYHFNVNSIFLNSTKSKLSTIHLKYLGKYLSGAMNFLRNGWSY